MAVGSNYNNPGDLTVNYSGQMLYQGQTSTYSSPNGLVYAVFGSIQDGWNALTTYIENNTGTDSSNSEASNSELVGHYLNGSENGVVATAANPYPNTYLNILDNSTGLSANQQYTAAQLQDPSFVQSLETGIAKGEGTFAAFGAAPTPNLGGSSSSIGGSTLGVSTSGLSSGLGSAFTSLTNAAGAALGLGTAAGNITGTAAGSLSGSAVGAAAGGSTPGLFGPLIDWFNQQVKGIEGGVEGFLERGAFGGIGFVLIVAGLILVVATNKTVQNGVKTAAVAAA